MSEVSETLPGGRRAGGVRELVHAEGFDSATDVTTGMFGSRLVAVPFAIVLLVTVDCAAYTYGGAPWGISVTIASILAFLGWVLTTLRRPPGAPAAFCLYIGTVAALILLEAEEWRWGMPSRLMKLYPTSFPAGVGITEHAFIAVFPLSVSAFLVLGALMYYQGAAVGRFSAWLTFAWGLVGSLSVYAYLLAAGPPYRYLGGMVSAPIPLLLSAAGIFRLLRREGLDDGHTPAHHAQRASAIGDATSHGRGRS